MSDHDPLYPERVPPISRLLWRGFTGRCPACGRSGIGKRWVGNVERCDRCGLAYERIEGHFVGSVGMNTIVSFGVLLISVIVSMIVTYPDPPILGLILFNAAVAAFMPVFFLPMSRTLWTAIDIAMRPLEAHEVDWEKVYASLGREGNAPPEAPRQPGDHSDDKGTIDGTP